MPENECCGRCRFFLPTEAPNGLCRRFPAKPMLMPTGAIVGQFTPMRTLGWCGEFKACEEVK